MKQRVSLIVAMASNGVIGNNNTLPWHLPADLKHFKTLTMGHHMVMGRKTYDSIGKPLPGRTTVVVTRNTDFAPPGVIVVNSFAAALTACGNDPEIFVIGGAQIFALALEHADKLYITEIKREILGDIFFPAIELNQWQEVAREQHQQTTPEPLEYHFVEYLRKPG